jgi:tRNA-binding EMAP/Myf-like protein
MEHKIISFSDFEKVDIRVGIIRKVFDFPQAKSQLFD